MGFDLKKVFGGTSGDKLEQQGTSEVAPLFDNSRIALSYRECAHALGLTESALRHLVHKRKIPFVKIGRTVRFIRQDIEAWLKKGATNVS